MNRLPGLLVGLTVGSASLAAEGSMAAAQAQTVPGTLGPAQQLPQGSPLPRVLPPPRPKLAPAPALPLAAPAAPASPGVVAVRAVAIDGATAYADAALAPFLAGLVGPAVPLAKIQAAREKLLARYQDDGYVLTAVEVTLDAAGTLRFVVTEGHITEVKLDGDIGPAGVQVLRFLRHLTLRTPVDAASLERWLLLAQDVPGISLRAVLRPSEDEPGALTLVAVVRRQAFAGLLTADNRAYELTGPEEFLGVFDAQSFTSVGEKTEVSLYGAARATQLFGQVASEFFVGGSGLKVRLYAGSGTADPTGFLGAEQYHGVTTTAGVSAQYPLIRARRQTLNLGLYLDILQSTIDTVGTLASEDDLRVLRLGADYLRQDSWLGGDRDALNAVSVRLGKGLPGLGGSTNGQPNPGRVGENVAFTKVGFEASRTQTLFAPWPEAAVALQGLLAGQYSGDVLPPAEKFFLGGSRYNRGFYSGEVTGDTALVASLELQLDTGLTLDWFATPWQVAAQFYAFYDWGETWERQSSDLNRRLASTGTGVRLNVTRYTEVDLEAVARLTRDPQGASGGEPALRQRALYWRVLTRF